MTFPNWFLDLKRYIKTFNPNHLELEVTSKGYVYYLFEDDCEEIKSTHCHVNNLYHVHVAITVSSEDWNLNEFTPIANTARELIRYLKNLWDSEHSIHLLTLSLNGYLEGNEVDDYAFYAKRKN